MKNLLQNRSIVLLLLITFFSACYYDVESELYPATTSTCDTATPTYSATIQPLIAASCAITGCHTSGAQSPDLSSYANLKASIERVKVRAITEKSMPPSGPLSSCSLESIDKWITSGAINN
ncbi:MAG TPA: hypothetical protein PLI68_13860 [Bacteroidia bacterium]|nr:hypothetical protein [Bacteroidia bacterium]